MAFDFSKLNFFNRLDARARVLVLFGVVIGIMVFVYVMTQYLSGSRKALGPSQVANAPANLQSVPGGTLTAEYAKALQQANVKSAEMAKMSGGSAVPTLVNYSTPSSGKSGCVICTEQSAQVKDLLDNWLNHGGIAPDVASQLQALANQNVPVSEYEATLDQLVKEGKLTPEQARELLAQYQRQHQNALLSQSGKFMDALIKSGKLPLDVANQLLSAQKRHMNLSDYANLLQSLVRDGKISLDTSQQLLSQYVQQYTKEVIQQSLAVVHQMAKNGQILPDIEKALEDLENKMVPMNVFASAIQGYVQSGRMVPAVADALLEEYRAQKESVTVASNVDQLLQEALNAAFDEINTLTHEGKMTSAVAQQLTDLIHSDVSLEAYQSAITQLVQSGKLSPDIAKLKLQDYQVIKNLEGLRSELMQLQSDNATAAAYQAALKQAVENGVITPAEAAALMQEYSAAMSKPVINTAGGATSSAFAALAEKAAAGVQSHATTVPATEQAFKSVQTQSTQTQLAEEQTNVAGLTSAMSGQAAQLVTAWQPNVMLHQGAAPSIKSTATAQGSGPNGGSSGGANGSAVAAAVAPLIKSGTIYFGVLDTGVNSDYPDSPVMVTVVDGPFKGATILGKVVTSKGPAGQLDRVALNFTVMNMPNWDKAKTITAYAIDPDTARTVMASSVDYHYMMKYGATFATAFLQGYANSITQAGTSTTGIFGTSTTHPSLSPGQKIATALGQVGQTLGTATQNYVNIPPTVKVDAGVGLGILFMSDVT
jgi:polyhydroxyalkanoate synthesis regulator phasin